MANPVISIDYDKTWTLNPSFWSQFALDAKKAGFDVVMATARFETPCNQDEVRQYVPHWIPVHFCGGLGLKRDVLKSRGVTVAVWIDDDPFSIDMADRYLVKWESGEQLFRAGSLTQMNSDAEELGF